MKSASTKSIIVLTAGKRFHELVIVGDTKVIDKRRYFLCQCDCGNQKFIRGDQIRNGKTKSCCRRFTNGITHGMKNTRFYQTWTGMLQRCRSSNLASWKNYGGRGIKVCKRWNKFENFRDDMLDSYLKHCEDFGVKETEIDRINVNGNYEQKNCRWATNKEQANNKRKSNFINPFPSISKE